MKILMLSTEDDRGGAAKAAYRLHQSLRNLEVTSQMFVQIAHSDDDTVINSNRNLYTKGMARGRAAIDSLPLKLMGKTANRYYSTQWFPNSELDRLTSIPADIINLHWINGGYIPIEFIKKLTPPLVWTLHDMWAFTGGCHYSDGCGRYQQSCGKCPVLNSNSNLDISRWIWQRKHRNWQNLNLTIVTPSHWLARAAAASSLFKDLRIEVIPNGIDIELYKPIDKSIARSILGLPQDRCLILFGALGNVNNQVKGFDLLLQAIEILAHRPISSHIDIVIIGSAPPHSSPITQFKTHYLGKLHDDISLALTYAAVDVLICPSREENLPNTILEALACGTPSVAFNIGGIPDLIEPEVTGYLASPFDVGELARGIEWVLTDRSRYLNLAQQCRQRAIDRFSNIQMARNYQHLFTELSAVNNGIRSTY
jgi:glycosyltransferase involved in cell wall biosynthesis